MSGATAAPFLQTPTLPCPAWRQAARVPSLVLLCVRVWARFLTATPCIFPSVKQCRQGTCSPICHSPHHSLLSHTPASLIYFIHGRECAAFPSASEMYPPFPLSSEPLPGLLVPPGCSRSTSPLVTRVIPSHAWGRSLPIYSRTLLFAQPPMRQHLSHCPKPARTLLGSA